MQLMDERETEQPRPRRPICPDCMGRGVSMQPKMILHRHPDGEAFGGSVLHESRCPSCRGIGKAGTP